MKKNYVLFALSILCIAALCWGCTAPATLGDAWLPAEFAQENIASWNLFVENGGVHMAMTNTADMKATYAPEQGLTTAEDASYNGGSALKGEQLPPLADAIDAWLAKQEKEHAAGYAVSLVGPHFAFAGQTDMGSAERAVYSLSTGKIKALEGNYTGSKDYGIITVLGSNFFGLPTGVGSWTIYVDA